MATYTTNYNLEKPEASDPFGDFRESYNDNLDIIDANLGGGGGGGDVVDVEVNGVSVVDGSKVAKIISYKEVTQAQYDALPASKLTDGIAYFIKDGGGGSGGGSFLLVISADAGETVTATKDGTTLAATEVSTGIYEVEVTSSGTWTISDGTNTATVDVGVYTATLSSVPEGSTVLPTDDVQILLNCADIWDKAYTTIAQLLADTTSLMTVISDNNAIDYLVRSTTFASSVTADSSAMTYTGLNNYASNTLLADSTWSNAICNSTYFESVLNVKVPTMTSNTTPSGVASASVIASATYDAYKAFDENSGTWWSSNTYANQYVQYDFGETVKLCASDIYPYYSSGNYLNVKHYAIEMSDDGVTWNTAFDETLPNTNISSTGKFSSFVACSGRYARCYVFNTYGNRNAAIYKLQLYGRKEV